jgi:hypothetical protein
MKKIAPPVLLFFLAPITGEMLSGSAPPVEFFTPVGFIVLAILYGGGAILVREAVIRWRKGWASLLLLGAAYGIIEEGLMVKSFFDPLWQDIDVLGSYGRWGGINWIWSLELTIYHAVISIAIPILLTELIFPHGRHDSWLSKTSIVVLSVWFVINVVVGNFIMTEYQPGALQYLLGIAGVVILILIARILPHRISVIEERKVGHPFRFWLLSFIAAILFMITFWALPNTSIPAFVTAAIGIALAAFFIWWVMRLSGNTHAWDDRHRLALASGPLSVFILMTPIHEFDSSRTDNTSGMIVVGIAALVFLVWLNWRTAKRIKEAANE